jgi:hypothetical protein
MKTSYLPIAFAAANAVLYSALLPLWEGFDEPFHYGYVQRLADGGGLPNARTEALSREVAVSLTLAPAGESVKANLPRVTSYAEYFAWTPEQRAKTRRELDGIPVEYARQPSDIGNYEAHQTPLAYLLLAGPARILAGAPLPSRILVLRILAALAGGLLLYSGGGALCRELGLGEPYRSMALFCALATQMTWATLAHIANDWLAAPLAIWALVFLMRCTANRGMGQIVAAALVVSAGLLAKAYFLALVPVLLGVCAVRRGWRGVAAAGGILALCAGPWYVRNLRLYGDLTGMEQSRAGVGAAAVLRAAPAVDWRKVAVDSARLGLWTGNNTFRTFSVATLDAVLAIMAVGLLLWAFRRRSPAEWTYVAYCGAFAAALAYEGVQTYAFQHGVVTVPSAWHSQTLVTPLLILAFLGASRWRRAGVAPAALLTLLFGYVLAATYLVKLIPMYGGYAGRGSLREIAALYLTHFGALRANLECAALGPVALIFGLTAVVVGLIVTIEIGELSAIWRRLSAKGDSGVA